MKDLIERIMCGELNRIIEEAETHISDDAVQEVVDVFEWTHEMYCKAYDSSKFAKEFVENYDIDMEGESEYCGAVAGYLENYNNSSLQNVADKYKVDIDELQKLALTKVSY